MSLDTHILTELQVSLINIGLYLSIGVFLVLTFNLLASNYNKVVDSGWSLSLMISTITSVLFVLGLHYINNAGLDLDFFMINYIYVSLYLHFWLYMYLIYINYNNIPFTVGSLIYWFTMNKPILVFKIYIFIIGLVYFGDNFDYTSLNSGTLNLAPEDMCNAQDVGPIHENRLSVVYNKLLRLAPRGDNAGLAMNSPRLINGLDFTALDRRTMHTQITNAHPNMMFRFNNTDNPHSFSYPNQITSQILQLFAPTNG